MHNIELEYIHMINDEIIISTVSFLILELKRDYIKTWKYIYSESLSFSICIRVRLGCGIRRIRRSPVILRKLKYRMKK